MRDDAVAAGAIERPDWKNGAFEIAGVHTEVPSEAEDPQALAEYLVGRTITGASVDLVTEDWQQGKSIYLQLDDGAVLEIAGYGYDAYGTEARFWRGGPEAESAS